MAMDCHSGKKCQRRAGANVRRGFVPGHGSLKASIALRKSLQIHMARNGWSDSNAMPSYRVGFTRCSPNGLFRLYMGWVRVF
jgi:hypothetical protein